MATLAARAGAAAWCCNGAASSTGSEVRLRLPVFKEVTALVSSVKCNHYQGRLVRRIEHGMYTTSPIMSTFRPFIKCKAGGLSEEAGSFEVSTLEAPSAVEDSALEGEPVTKLEDTLEEQDTTPMARVTFTLQKEIHFGQTFNLVGSLPELGQWDVAAAVPLMWSEGHVWSTQLAIPVGKTGEYKFVLTGSQGELKWQPGANKLFTTTDSRDLLLCEPWEESEALTGIPPSEASAGVTKQVESIGEESGVDIVGLDSDLIKSTTELVEEAGPEEDAVDDSLPDLKETSGSYVNGSSEGQKSEVPLVEAAIVASLAEVSGDVEDPAAAKV